MQDSDLFVLARIIHVIGVVLWIGGVAFVTTVLLPALRRHRDPNQRFQLFEALEGRFSLQAKFVTAMTGLSGLYMIHVLDAWSRYLDSRFWWMHMMTAIWLVFTLVLFVLEPLFLHEWFRSHAKKDSGGTFRLIQRFHVVLLVLSLIAVAGAVAGVRGYSF